MPELPTYTAEFNDLWFAIPKMARQRAQKKEAWKFYKALTDTGYSPEVIHQATILSYRGTEAGWERSVMIQLRDNVEPEILKIIKIESGEPRLNEKTGMWE